MNQEVKEQWVAALRSGEYTQGQNYLNRDGKMCCLGVLCDLAEKAGVVQGSAGTTGVWDDDLDETVYAATTSYNGDYEEPPPSVQGWAGLTTANPIVPITDPRVWRTRTSLAELNDAHAFSLQEIADVIEREL